MKSLGKKKLGIHWKRRKEAAIIIVEGKEKKSLNVQATPAAGKERKREVHFVEGRRRKEK